MNQLNLLPDVTPKVVWNKGDISFSLSFDSDKILRDIMRLYNNSQPFDVDVTYSKGVMWRKLPQPLQKFDIAPLTEDVTQASADRLPLSDNSRGSIMFDPPFMFSQSLNNPGRIKTRFTAFDSLDQMLTLYEGAMLEFYRVLWPGGIFVFKCQDGVSNGKNHFMHFEVEKFAREIGYNQLDLFILGSKRVMISSTWKRQMHARKSHSFFLVFEKPTPKRKKGK